MAGTAEVVTPTERFPGATYQDLFLWRRIPAMRPLPAVSVIRASHVGIQVGICLHTKALIRSRCALYQFISPLSPKLIVRYHLITPAANRRLANRTRSHRSDLSHLSLALAWHSSYHLLLLSVCVFPSGPFLYSCTKLFKMMASTHCRGEAPAKDGAAAEFGVPFNYPDADLIVRSSDGVDFRVYRAVLERSSPLFSKMLLEQRDSNIMTTVDAGSGKARLSPNTLPVLRLPESKTTIHVLLTFIFPVPSCLPATFEDTIPVLVAAKKYKAQAALSMLRICLNGVTRTAVRTSDAFRVFCLARGHGLRSDALGPARVALDLPITIEDLGDKLIFATATSLHDLLHYKRIFQTRLSSAIAGFRKSEELKTLWRTRDKVCTTTMPSGVPQWLHGVLEVMAHDRPLLDQMRFYIALQSHLSQQACPLCQAPPIEVKALFWDAVGRVINAAVSQAETDLVRDENAWTTHFDFPVPSSNSQEISYQNPANADVILRSEDGKDFHAHRLILAIASPVFRGMFSLPNPPTNFAGGSHDMRDVLPVICMTEPSLVLGNLLALLYPDSLPAGGSYTLTLHLLAAAQKYEMERTTLLIRKLASAGHFAKEPTSSDELFLAYAFAVRHRLRQEVEDLAMYSLGKQLSFKEFGDALRFLEGPAIHALSQYRTNCRCVIVTRIQSVINLVSPSARTFLQPVNRRFMVKRPILGPQPPASLVFHGTFNTSPTHDYREYTNCTEVVGDTKPRWWDNFLCTLKQDVSSGVKHPSVGSLAIKESFQSFLQSHTAIHEGYFMCVTTYTERGPSFCSTFEDELEKAIRSVPFKYP
ncbi:hypothetical protein BC834DRAFT_270486 [Gloeopeniophorella convolvens]|nr:hypothetical protein BC834DRAFT_270486 [Gloeopeniophorella convolvens]